jgi:hypothetical protein
LALVGGAYHEAWHTLYSRRKTLCLEDVETAVLSRWARVPDWSKFHKLLQEWNNIIEDIRIERLGTKEFPGTRRKMAELQDFVLRQEAEGRANARAHGHETNGAMGVVAGVFRDVGLGYNTDLQKKAMVGYREENELAVQLVLDGPLSPVLRQAIELTAEDANECIFLAMDVIAILSELGGFEDGEGEGEGEGQGKPPVCECPKCKAPGSKLKVRPMSDGYGGKKQGVGLLVCTVCGHSEEVELQSGGGGGESSDSESPVFEGFDPEDFQSNGGSGSSSDAQEEQNGNSGGKTSNSKNDSKSDQSQQADGDQSEEGAEEGDQSEGGAGGSSEDSESEEGAEAAGGESAEDGDAAEAEADSEGSENGESGEESKDAESNDKDGEDSESEGSEGSDEADDASAKNQDGSEDSEEAQPQKDGENREKSQHPGEHTGGGFDSGADQADGSLFEDLANEILNQIEDGETTTTGLLDGNSALEEAFGEANDKAENRENGDVLEGEAAYAPYHTHEDKVEFVQPSIKGRDHDQRRADRILKSVKGEASFLRARLRTIVRAMEMTDTVHGLRRGRGLSERFLVDSKVALMGSQVPKRAYYNRDDQLDTSMAASIVIDQSSSMSELLKDATRVMCALTEPMDALGVKVQVTGFRNGRYSYYDDYNRPNNETRSYHRYESIRHDVFKSFDERFSAVKWRFANTMAVGSTPMADGIQLGLDSLSERKEAHRVLFVITDGCPDSAHGPVVNRQIRLAKEAGIHVVGVGLGWGAQYVEKLFPDSVFSNSINEIPKMLVAKLNDLLDFRAAKRGRRMKKTG